MARKRRGNPVHGWLIIDKPLGISSAKAVARARAIMEAQKAGHAGTLDPLATGVLPIALGEATKTVSWVMNGSKSYRFTVCWGEARTTDDMEGAVTETSDIRPTTDAISAVLGEFVGEIQQTPPIYSAIKVDGRRAYDLARSDEAVELKTRIVTIDSLELIEIPDSDHAVFEVHCGKGTYVRSLARDMAVRLGTVGHIQAIRRLSSGPFEESDAISLDKLESLRHIAPQQDYLLPVETALDDIPALAMTTTQADHLKHGRSVRVRGAGGLQFVEMEDLDDGTTACAMLDGKPVALVRLCGDEIQPVRVLNL
jgi:tRNA pseudouridine55 synthase